MTIEIKNIEFNSDLVGFEIHLKDGRTAYIQAEQEQNILDAAYCDYSICSYDPEDVFSEEELAEIVEQSNKLEDVKNWIAQLDSKFDDNNEDVKTFRKRHYF